MAPFRTAMVDKNSMLSPCCGYMSQNTAKTFSVVKHVKQWWNSELETLRNDITHGNRANPGCVYCFQQEQNPNSVSLRKAINLGYSQKEIEQTIADYKQGIIPDINSIHSLELRFSNYCNLRCIMCGPYASSSIAQEYRDHAEAYQTINLHSNEKTIRWWEDIENLQVLKDLLINVSSLQLSGGEPLLIPETSDILNSLDPNKIQSISITTNLTKLNDRILQSINKFKLVNITVSLEGYGKHNDYLRYGSDWHTIEKNIKILTSLKNVNLKIHHILQHTSLYSLPQLAEFANNNKISMSLNEVYYQSLPEPGVLTINSAEHNIVTNFNLWLENYQGQHKKILENWVKSYRYDPNLNTKFSKYINVLDNIRGNSFSDTFLKT